MSGANPLIFHAHTFFLGATLVLGRLPGLLAPEILLMPSQAGVALTWSTTVFWVLRPVVRWSRYHTARGCGKGFVTVVHFVFSFVRL
jgi:uncharacterized membrane protein